MDNASPSATDQNHKQPPKHARQRNSSSTDAPHPKKSRARAKQSATPDASATARESSPTTATAVDHGVSLLFFSALSGLYASRPYLREHSFNVSTARTSNVRESEASTLRYPTHTSQYPAPPQQPYVYAMNGNPYQPAQSPYHAQSQAASGHNGHPTQVGPGIPGHPQYPYAVTHPAYGYSAYSPYPSMVMYGAAPGPSHAPHTPHAEQPSAESSPPPSSATTGKRKRKYTVWLYAMLSLTVELIHVRQQIPPVTLGEQPQRAPPLPRRTPKRGQRHNVPVIVVEVVR